MNCRYLLPSLILVVSGACATTGFNAPLDPPLERMRAPSGELHSQVWVDPVSREVVVLAGPFDVPHSMGMDDPMSDHGHDHSMKTPLIPLVWPVEQGMQGFRLAAYQADGTPLPRHIMHHVIAVNFDRRQLVYPIPERIFGFGTETPDVRLPDLWSVPVQMGDSIGMYAMWHNETGRDLEDVYIQVVLPFADPDSDPEPVMPIYMDTNNQIGGKTSFDLPPGRFEKSYEFEIPVDGGLLAAGGHLHDYGVELRLEDAASGKVLAHLEAETDEDGRLDGVEHKIFRRFFKLLDARIPLEAGRKYRIVGVYHNPTDATIPDGGMAHMVGLFAPSDPAAWPEMDPTNPHYIEDVRALPGTAVTTHRHSGEGSR